MICGVEYCFLFQSPLARFNARKKDLNTTVQIKGGFSVHGGSKLVGLF